MLAVGKDNPGTTAQTLHAMSTSWDMRSGKDFKYAVWKDELDDAMASIGLDVRCITDEPPEEPDRLSLCPHSHELWVNAVLQYQAEGTALYNIVRPSLLISGDYAQMDMRAISEMKRINKTGQMVKDGRALLRLALSHVDYSSLSCQIKLMEELNKKKIEVNATKLQLSTHMISLLELWLQKEGANINNPAEYFQRLLMSMPTGTEGALLRVRSKIADMINEDSIILKHLDGENGFFAWIDKYAESQGVKNVKEEQARDIGSLNAIQVHAEQCNECYSWICRKMAKDCICNNASTFDINKIVPGPKKDFVVLNREYSKQNPSASLRIDAADMRRALKGGQGTLHALMGVTDAMTLETATTDDFMATVASVLGDEICDNSEVDAWLAAQGVEDGFFMLNSATPLKTKGEGNCKTPMPADNFKANLALDTPKSLNELVGVSPKQLYSNFKKTEEAASEGGGVDQIVQHVLRLAASWAGRFTTAATDLASYFINLPKSQLATIGLAVYASHAKIKTMLRTLIKWITTEYFKMEAEPRQRIAAILIKIKNVIAQIAIK